MVVAVTKRENGQFKLMLWTSCEKKAENFLSQYFLNLTQIVRTKKNSTVARLPPKAKTATVAASNQQVYNLRFG